MATLKTDLEAALAQVADLNSKLSLSQTELTAKITAHDALVANLNSQITALNANKTALDEKITKLEGENLTLTGKVTKLEAESKSSDVKATEKAAAHGILPVKTDASGKQAAQSGEALYEQYDKLKGAERTEFFRANEKALMAHARAQESLTA